MSGTAEPTVTLTLARSDWALVMQVLQQALAPYHRLGVVMQGMQAQAAEGASHAAQQDGQQSSAQVERLARAHGVQP
jgi:hypothetical protein